MIFIKNANTNEIFEQWIDIIADTNISARVHKEKTSIINMGLDLEQIKGNTRRRSCL